MHLHRRLLADGRAGMRRGPGGLTWGRRTSFVLLAGAALFGAGSLFWNAWYWFGPAAWSGRLYAASPVAAVGVRPRAEPVKGAFTISNSGMRELCITQVKVGCTCVSVQLERRCLRPGEALSLPFAVDLKKIKSTISQPIVVRADSGPPLVLRIEGSVEP